MGGSEYRHLGEADMVLNQLSKVELYWKLRAACKERAQADQTIDRASLVSRMGQSGMDKALRSQAFLLHERNRKAQTAHSQDDQLDIIIKIKKDWSNEVCGRLNSVASAVTVPLESNAEIEMERRIFSQESMKDTENDASAGASSHCRTPLSEQPYTVQNLLNAILSIGSNQRKGETKSMRPSRTSRGGQIPEWGSLGLNLNSKGNRAIAERFADLSLTLRQCGFDDAFGSGWFAKSRRNCADMEITSGQVHTSRIFLRRGVPPSHRARLWKTCLGLRTVSSLDRSYFNWLCLEIDSQEFLLDCCLSHDVSQISNDESFFIFDEKIRLIMLAFMRDTTVPEKCAIQHPTMELQSSLPGKKRRLYPPSGVIPFDGICRYVAPLCYLDRSTTETYFAFRELYMRYFCKLHTLDTTLLTLCSLFEDILQENQSALYFRMLELGVPPLEIAFPWMVHAFVGHLGVENVLNLWDRIIGFDSLDILPVAAAAVISFRKKIVMAATCADDIRDTFKDLRELKIVPLIQDLLFSLKL